MKVPVGENFTVNVTVEGCVNVCAVQVYIRYDPEVLEVVKILEGPFLPSFGSTLLLLNETKENLEATPPYGEVRFVDSLLGDVPGASGSGLLFNVTFRVLSDGSSHLHFVEYVPKSGGDGTYFMDKNLNEIYPELYDDFYDGIPPKMSDPWQDPPANNVQPFQTVTVWVNVTDVGTGIKNVTLWYSLDNGTSWTIINMTALPIPSDTWITYEATIDGYENCTWVTYKIIAYDNAGNNATKDNNGYGYKYHVIPEFPSTTILTIFMLTTTVLAVLTRSRRLKHRFNNR
jgi:hypothetical protein